MHLSTILNHSHHFRGFVYQQPRLDRDHHILEVVVWPRRGSAAICSGCHQAAPGYDRLAERRFECERQRKPPVSRVNLVVK